MGQAKHKKKMLALGPRTKGIGFKYVQTPLDPEPTEEQLAAKAVRQQEQQTLDRERQHRREMVAVITAGAEKMLGKWKQQIDENAVRLRDFAGWTTAAVCSLPVDSDAARVYRTQFSKHRTRETRLTLEMMDDIVRKVLHEHKSGTVVADILDMVKTAAEQSANGTDFDKQLFLDTLSKRQRREKANHDWVCYGLGYVREAMEKGLRVENT